MEIEDRIRKGRTVYYIYWEHLGWWKKSRFQNFYLERVKNGVPFLEVIETWNKHATRAEDTVYVVQKLSTELYSIWQDCVDNRGRCSAQERDSKRVTESE